MHGIDNPILLQHGDFRFAEEHDMTPQTCIVQLTGTEKAVFSKLYAGSASRKLYRLFEFRKG